MDTRAKERENNKALGILCISHLLGIALAVLKVFCITDITLCLILLHHINLVKERVRERSAIAVDVVIIETWINVEIKKTRRDQVHLYLVGFILSSTLQSMMLPEHAAKCKQAGNGVDTKENIFVFPWQIFYYMPPCCRVQVMSELMARRRL